MALATASALVSLAVAGCGAGSAPAPAAAGAPRVPGSPPAASSAAASAAASPSGSATATAGASGTAVGSAPAVPACRSAQAAAAGDGVLTGIQFVTAARGWAVGQDTILMTADGGAHWTPQLSGQLNLTSVDFISGQDGWAVGTKTLLATTDGGARWTKLPEPCPVIRSVHFISPTTGFAVAGGSNGGGSSDIPVTGGVVLATSDGGRHWHSLAAPADAQTVCFTDPEHGWLGAAGVLSMTSDGGRLWTTLTSTAGAGPDGAGDPALMSVECANGAAWALRIGPGAGMSQQAHVGYHADQAGVTALFAEQYFQTPGTGPTREAPGSDPGPFSAIDSSAAAFIDSCSACGVGTAPWDLVTGSGATLTREGNVALVTDPEAASFASRQDGWVAGYVSQWNAAGQSRDQQRIVATTDGGRTWHVEYAGPWSAWTG